jgi:hypothetical protein
VRIHLVDISNIAGVRHTGIEYTGQQNEENEIRKYIQSSKFVIGRPTEQYTKEDSLHNKFSN